MKRYDIIVVGAGYAGLTAALAIESLGLKVLVIEKRKLVVSKQKGEPSRLLAIAYKSCEIYNQYGIIKDFSKLGQPIKKIRVMDAKSDDLLEFNPNDISVDNFGYMVEEHDLHLALIDKAKNIEILDDSEIVEISQDSIAAKVTLKNGKSYSAPLVIVADGKHSETRQRLEIEVRKHDYRQFAVVCDLKHELPHGGIATERFLPTGPFGILPKKDGYTSSIVWSVEKEMMPAIKQMDSAILLEVISERFGDYLGKIEFASDVKFFPLDLVQAKKYFEGRFVLVGDSAHAIHPLAGQGLNLSIRDIDKLAKLLKIQIELGLDLGSRIMLETYVKERSFDNSLMIESTHGLNYLFSNNLLPIKFLRRKGLAIVNKISPLKKMFMRYACGMSS
jgi:2-octaprenyl-6-methoxyphenol hydroxylase